MELVFTSGISGCDRKRYCGDFVKYGNSRGKKIEVFDIGRMMIQQAYDIGYPINLKNILHADKAFLAALRSAIFTKIGNEIRSRLFSYDAVIINMHNWLFGKELFWLTSDRFLDNFLNEFPADIYITFVDDFRHIYNRLSQREQWDSERLTYTKILYWQNIEVEFTRGLANTRYKPFFALATGQPAWTLYKLIFHPEVETVYVKMPISHFRAPEKREIIDNFIKELDKPFNVFSPLAVEIVGVTPINQFDDEEIRTIDHHVVNRDLDWFVEQCDLGINIWPEVVPSPGVDHETHRSYIRTKEEWTVYLGKERSPFISFFNTGFFRSTEEFFEFVYKKYPERKNLSW
ncbi:MAG: hypothetical protein HYW79_03445 [Parcubacteria group bacterium]|nr:hypothetical protein [Parcubacteria group bacterium]